jgi:MFS family permease
LLGFAAGLPYMLVFSTLSVWLREAGVARETIGYASLIGLAYAFKWVWSPLLDQWRLPLLGKLGRRRSWLVLSQALVILGLIGMGFCDPQKHLSWLIAIAVVIARPPWLPATCPATESPRCWQPPVPCILPKVSVLPASTTSTRHGPAPTYCSAS